MDDSTFDDNEKNFGSDVNPLSGLEAVLVIGQRIKPIETPVSYINERVPMVAWIQWTNNWITNSPPSEIVIYRHGKQVASHALLTIIPPKWLVLPLMPITYFITLATFILAAWKVGVKFDLCLGFTQFPSFIGIVLRRLGIAKKTIFMNYDYFPVKPWTVYALVTIISNWMVKYATNCCDAAWYITPRILEKQISVGMIKNTSNPRLIVPLGIKRQEILESRNYISGQIVFVGQLGAHQGIQLVIEAMPNVRKAIPNARFVVIGSGPYETDLRKIVAERGLKMAIEITGYASHDEIHELLSRSALAVAPYVPDPYSFTYYAHPGKIMLYLSYGLPVIVTNVPPIAETVQEKGAGLIIEYDADLLAHALISLLRDHEKLDQYRKHALALAREYDAEKIYNKAFKDTLSQLKMT